MALGLEHYLVLGAILFCIGLYGALTRRNAIVILMSIELMLNAVNITMVAFSRNIVPAALTVQVFALFIMAVLLVYKPSFTWPGLGIVVSGVPVYYIWRWFGARVSS